MAKKKRKKKDREYPVGYGKPPKHSQFKPGQSGNPSGRPKKAKTIADAFSKLARKVVTVPTKNGNKRMSMLDLIANKHFGMAANGNHKSTEIVLRALIPTEANHDNNIDDLLLEFREKNARIADENQDPANTADREDSPQCDPRQANEGTDR